MRIIQFLLPGKKMVDLEKYQKIYSKIYNFLSDNTIKINVKMKGRKKFFQLN